MKNLVLGSLVTALAASGCIITTSSPPDTAHVGATWKFKDLATNTMTGCPAGTDNAGRPFTTAALYTQEVDANGNPIGRCQQLTDVSGTCNIDLFNCGDFAGRSAPLLPDTWKTWIQIQTDHLESTYASTTPTIVDVTNVDLNYNAEILNDGGYFYVSWQLVGKSSGAPLTCAQAGASQNGVEAVVTTSGGADLHSDMFTCEDGAGYTSGYIAANYTVSVDALNSNMQSIGTAPTLTQQPIGRQNAITSLPKSMIAIQGM